MTTIIVSGQRLIVDDEDAIRVRSLNPWIDDTTGYAKYSVPGRRQRYLHAFLTDYYRQCGTRGGLHTRHCVDHINGNKLDNRKSNLRIVNWTVNQVNRHRLNVNNKSGVRGVCFNPHPLSKPWKATIYKHYRTINLGQFADIRDAIAVRKAAEVQYFGGLCPVP